MYFLENLHKNLQRLSSFALCIRNAPLSRAISALQLGAAYKEYIAKKVPVSPENTSRIAQYIAERALVKKYASANDMTVDGIRKKLIAGMNIESQDWFLSEPCLLSATGAEREQSYVQTVNACQEIGLLQEKTLVLTSYGLLVKEIAKKYRIIDEQKELDRNPFYPNIAYFITAFLPIVQKDRLFLRNLFPKLPNQFSFSEICNLMEDVLTGIYNSIPSAITTRSIKEQLKNQIKAAHKLTERLKTGGWSKEQKEKDLKKIHNGKVSIQTLYRPFEDILLPRLEFLVDIGALSKDQPWHYNYTKTNKYEIVSRYLESNSPMDKYFSISAELYDRKIRYVTKSELIDHLISGYKKFKNLAGYAPILETTVHANILSIDQDPWPIIEVTDCLKFLLEIARENSSTIRINADRHGQPYTFKVGVEQS